MSKVCQFQCCHFTPISWHVESVPGPSAKAGTLLAFLNSRKTPLDISSFANFFAVGNDKLDVGVRTCSPFSFFLEWISVSRKTCHRAPALL